jgi:hypothetical protein
MPPHALRASVLSASLRFRLGCSPTFFFSTLMPFWLITLTPISTRFFSAFLSPAFFRFVCGNVPYSSALLLSLFSLSISVTHFSLDPELDVQESFSAPL